MVWARPTADDRTTTSVDSPATPGTAAAVVLRSLSDLCPGSIEKSALLLLVAAVRSDCGIARHLEMDSLK